MPKSQKMNPTCAACGAKTQLRKRESDGAQFYGCVRYPDCKYTIGIDEEHTIGSQERFVAAFERLVDIADRVATKYLKV